MAKDSFERRSCIAGIKSTLKIVFIELFVSQQCTLWNIYKLILKIYLPSDLKKL